MTDLMIFAIIFGVLALMNMYRFIKGPNAADRMVAADSTDIMISCAMVMFSSTPEEAFIWTLPLSAPCSAS